ncbi:MAG: hypothetical protein HQL31_07560 [Planctomycetes bacterium]|nr:hypothetical protein [Planctomycetota bacterium]
MNNENKTISLQRLTTRNYKNISSSERGLELQDLNIFIGSYGTGKGSSRTASLLQPVFHAVRVFCGEKT